MNKSSLLLAALLAVALTACGKDDEPTQTTAPAPAPTTQPATSPPQQTASEQADEAAKAAAEAVDEAVEAAEAAVDEAAVAIENAAEEVAEATSSAVESAEEAIVGIDVAPLSAVDAENLAKAKNCLACHAIDRKLVGPSYTEVAEKRAGEGDAVAVLAEKIQKGGSGVYGAVPMPPNPQVNAEEAAQLAQWVLSLQ